MATMPGTVRDESLNGTGEGVEDGGTLLVVNAIAVTDLFGNTPHRENGYRIVGGTYINEGDEGGNAEFGPSFAVHMTGDHVDEKVDTALLLDES